MLRPTFFLISWCFAINAYPQKSQTQKKQSEDEKLKKLGNKKEAKTKKNLMYQVKSFL